MQGGRTVDAEALEVNNDFFGEVDVHESRQLRGINADSIAVGLDRNGKQNQHRCKHEPAPRTLTHASSSPAGFFTFTP